MSMQEFIGYLSKADPELHALLTKEQSVGNAVRADLAAYIKAINGWRTGDIEKARVRTPAGARKYGLPIGALIVPNAPRAKTARSRNAQTVMRDPLTPASALTDEGKAAHKRHKFPNPEQALKADVVDRLVARLADVPDDVLLSLGGGTRGTLASRWLESVQQGTDPHKALGRWMLVGPRGKVEYYNGTEANAKKKVVSDSSKWGKWRLPEYTDYIDTADSARMSLEFRKAVISQVLEDWAGSSQGGLADYMHEAMQRFHPRAANASRQARGWWGSSKKPNHEGDKIETAADAVVRAMYDETQEFFKSHGITEVTVFRGMNDVDIEPGKAGVQSNPLSSWSFDPSVALNFAEDGNDYDRHGIVMSMVIPVSDVACTAATGLGCLMEAEAVIVGGRHDVVAMLPGEFTSKWGAAPHWGSSLSVHRGAVTRKPALPKSSSKVKPAREIDIQNPPRPDIAYPADYAATHHVTGGRRFRWDEEAQGFVVLERKRKPSDPKVLPPDRITPLLEQGKTPTPSIARSVEDVITASLSRGLGQPHGMGGTYVLNIGRADDKETLKDLLTGMNPGTKWATVGSKEFGWWLWDGNTWYSSYSYTGDDDVDYGGGYDEYEFVDEQLENGTLEWNAARRDIDDDGNFVFVRMRPDRQIESFFEDIHENPITFDQTPQGKKRARLAGKKKVAKKAIYKKKKWGHKKKVVIKKKAPAKLTKSDRLRYTQAGRLR